MFDCIRTVSCSGLGFFKEKKKAALATLWFVLAWHYLLSWIRKTKSVLLGFCFRADLSRERLNQQRAWQGQQSFPQLLSSAEFAFCASGTAGCAEQETQLCSLGYHTQG